MKQVVILVAMIALGLLLFGGISLIGDKGTMVTDSMNDSIEGMPQFGQMFAPPDTTPLLGN